MKKTIVYFFLIQLSFVCAQEKHVIGGRSVGLFSNFIGVLNNLVWCIKHNKAPVAYWGENDCYFQKEGFNGAFNVWEYYFKPLSNQTYQPGDPIHSEYFAPNGFQISGNPEKLHHAFSPVLRKQFNYLIQRYISLKEPLQKAVDDFYYKHIAGKPTIGVHIRGTDKSKEARAISVARFVEEIEKFDASYQVFLATDEQKIVDEFLKTCNRTVVYCNAQRSANSLPLHYKIPELHQGSHDAILGQEVIVDTYLLSRCDIFIHSVSNVVLAVLFLNPDLKNVFVY
ncbi:MAG: hypothetical protein AB7R69_02385 [Candidatus Babeliales bacterium]